MTVNDDETQGLTLAATTLTGSGVTEGGSAVTYTARLASAPTGPVRVQITGGAGAVSVDTNAAAGLQNTLLFNAANYSTPQTVTVTPLEDDDGESESVTLNHAIFGADYQDLDDVALAFTATDNDTRGATLSTTSLNVQENGTATYTLVLDTQPVNGNVSVAVASSATAVATVEPATLTFTAQSWNVPQTVTVAGVDDAAADDSAANVTHTPTGADYGSVTISSVTVVVGDDEPAGLKVSPTSLTVAEGATATYTVRLNTAPTGAVTVTVGGATAKATADTDTGTTGDQTTLSFDATNWNTAQTVTVTGAEDADGADETVGLTHAVTGTGTYASLAAIRRFGVAVQVRDDETAGVVVSPTSLTIDEGGTATYTVRLSAPPATGLVPVNVAASGAAGVTVDMSTLNFSTVTWDTAQTVTVTAVADHTRVANGAATVTHTVAGNYPVTAGPDVQVQVRNTTGDYDADADGLIEIATLAQLNAMRWDLDGDGTASSGDETTYAAAFPNPRGGTVCPTTITGVACTGYELSANLDFDTNGNGRTWTTSGGALTGDGDEYDNSGMGWEPIGTDAARFAAVFRGNGRTIDNLFVNRAGLVGLFGSTDATARLESVGLRNARVAGSGVVGILAGEAHGDVVGCYATGTAGSPTTPTVGGLVGQLRGEITASYSTAAVDGSDQIGGLVGAVVGDFGQTRMVSASYAVGRTSALPEGLWAGGLMGRAFPILPESAVSAPDSYYDRATTTRTQSARGEALTTAALQSPTGYVGVYRNWNKDLDGDGQMDDPWNFGTSSQYPKLKWQGFDAERQRFPSSEEEPTTTTPTSRVPTAVRAESTGQGLFVTWRAAAGATAYRVQWRQSGAVVVDVAAGGDDPDELRDRRPGGRNVRSAGAAGGQRPSRRTVGAGPGRSGRDGQPPAARARPRRRRAGRRREGGGGSGRRLRGPGRRRAALLGRGGRQRGGGVGVRRDAAAARPARRGSDRDRHRDGPRRPVGERVLHRAGRRGGVAARPPGGAGGRRGHAAGATEPPAGSGRGSALAHGAGRRPDDGGRRRGGLRRLGRHGGVRRRRDARRDRRRGAGRRRHRTGAGALRRGTGRAG